MTELHESKFERMVEIPVDRYEDLLDTESKWWILAEAVRTHGIGYPLTEFAKLLFAEEYADHENGEGEDDA